MPSDENLERRLQALLDGRSLPPSGSDSDSIPSHDDPLCVLDALARAHRIALFGSDGPLDRQGSTMWGHLQVRGEIGRGASGTVYRAWDERLAREVALKLFDREAGAADAIAEGRLLARLNHPHIVKVFGADTHDGATGIWMELLEGETLDEVLDRDGVFSPEETLLVGMDLARALAAVHSAGLLHRDIKARNVLRERGGRIVLMDLGAGRIARETPRGGDETGTPMYMAPEVLMGGPATVRSDIYCLGVLLYRLLTGTFPVTADDISDLKSAHAAGRRASIGAVRQDLPVGLAATINRACDADPDARYSSAAEFELALALALQNCLSQRASVTPPIARTWMHWRRTVQGSLTALAVTWFAIWIAWDSTAGRQLRRAVGLEVPPLSTLYMTINGGLTILNGHALRLAPHNPATATVIAASIDQGIVTMSAIPPWIPGGRFYLDGRPAPSPPPTRQTQCCFSDGTTDGQFNYSPRTDSTLLEQRGSRHLEPPGLFRFSRDWTTPVMLFPLTPDGFYFGIAFSAASDSFWLTRSTSDGSVIEHWSRDGKLLSTPTVFSGALLTAIAVDPADGTLWAVRQGYPGDVMRLENFDTSGRHLASLQVAIPRINPFTSGGAEFAWAPRK